MEPSWGAFLEEYLDLALEGVLVHHPGVEIRDPAFQGMTTASWILQPAEFLQGQSGVPDFCHVDDLVAFKLHDVNVIGARASSRWWNRTTRARVRRVKHTVGRHVVSNCIGGERLDLILSIRQNRRHTFHPIGVLF